MKRTIISGLIFTGVIALASGCQSTPPERDFHEYADIHPGHRGYGDAVGSTLAPASYAKAANPRTTPTARPSNVAEIPQD